MTMRLLLTGYPGWLANRFVETLVQYPTPMTSVRCLINSELSGNIPSVPGLEFVRGNIVRPESLKGAAEGVDVVVHAAGVLHVRRIRDFYSINRDGTRHLLEAAAKAGVRRFIHISSNAAQGFCAGKGFELDESGPCRPESHYGKSKYEAEEVVREFQRAGKMETVILRPAMFYGPPVPPRHLDIYRKIRRGYFPVFGHGNYQRSITFIDHLVQAIHLAVQHPAAAGQTYYIADREIPTLNEILDAMGEALGRKPVKIHLPAFLACVAHILDEVLAACDRYWMLPHLVGESCKNIACRITKAETELGYNPATHYREGYKKTIAWCREKGLL